MVHWRQLFVKFTDYLTLKIVVNCNKRTNASLDGIVAIAILATTVIAPVNQAIATAAAITLVVQDLQSFRNAEVIAHRLGEPIWHLYQFPLIKTRAPIGAIRWT